MAIDHHNHNHAHSINVKEVNSKAFVIGIALNLLFVIIEVAAGFVYDSMALLTDAGHNLSDVASLVLSLIAFKLTKK